MGEYMQRFEVKVPGSTANLGPGFDSFGLALPLFLTIRVELAGETRISIIGEELASLPKDETNLIYRTIKEFCELEKKEVPPIHLEVESEIPLSRGIGSSGAAIVGGLITANHLLGNPKTNEELFNLATKMEGHADNVGASLYGGFVVTAFDGEKAKLEQLPFPDSLKILLAIPKYTLSTNTARRQIPESIPLKDTAFNIGHAALFITYLLTNQLEKLPEAVRDKVHQPYRQSAVHGLEKLLQSAEQHGMYSVALSGAGPTILLLSSENKLGFAREMVNRVAYEEKIELELLEVSAQQKGAQIIQLAESFVNKKE